MKRFKVKQIDVFTTTPFCGNPAAVILDAVGLEIKEMQAIAREMNLSETTFVLPPTTPGADYRLRIFTPRSELPFAGHPTIATVFAILDDGRLFKGEIPSLIRQECGIGIVPIVVEKRPSGLFFLMTQGQPRWITTDIDQALSAEMLGCGKDDVRNLPAEIVSTGVEWLIVPLNSLRAVQTLKPNLNLIEETCKKIGAVGITTFCMEAEHKDHTLRVRTFPPGEGVPEDPVCGSGNGSVAAYLAKQGLLSDSQFEYIAEQGSEIERPGLVTVKAHRNKEGNWVIQVGGQAVKIFDGEILF
jgi:PhzF family phenazine biosynthesis protein